MASGAISEFLQNIRRAALRRDEAGLTDGQLLDAYVRSREEEAFAALLHRHGPMVWGVCRRVVGDEGDAEDAFQATFLVLVRKAASVRPREQIANWLYGVARQTAVKARTLAVKRKVREKQVHDMPEPTALEQTGGSELLALLDRELGRLPDKYRTAIVLCDLEGKSYKEASRQLGCPEGTLAARLTRGRAMLAKRLAQHGLVLSGGTLATVLSQSASAEMPASMMASTIKTASLVAAGKAAATGTIAGLAEGVLKTMLLTKLKITATGFLFGVLIVGSGAVLLSSSVGAQQQSGEQARAERAAASKEDNLKNTLMTLDKALWDAYAKGDPTLVQKLYAEDYVGFSPNGRAEKKDALYSIRRNRPRELKIRDVELLRVAKNTAILTYVYDVKLMTPDGKLESVRSNDLVSHCWTQRDGGWVLVFVQDFVQPAPAAANQWRDLNLGFYPPAKALLGKSKQPAEELVVRDARRKALARLVAIAEIETSLKKLEMNTDDKTDREELARIERAIKVMKEKQISVDRVYPVKDLVIPVEPIHERK